MQPFRAVPITDIASNESISALIYNGKHVYVGFKSGPLSMYSISNHFVVEKVRYHENYCI